jgi:hypothetical protein
MRKKSNKTTLTTVFVIIMAASLLMGLGGFSRLTAVAPPTPENTTQWQQSQQPVNLDERVPCIDPNLPIPDKYHIHPHLTIIINGENITIPAGIGLEISGCERVLHTHDDSGTIHVEPNSYRPFTLGDFFAVWGKPFSRDRILDYVRDSEHEIVMTVDGKESDEFENLVLRDGQQIVIDYKSKTAK